MRLRNVKHAKKSIEENPDKVISNPKEHFGNWNELFANENSIEVEIGCGKGKFVFEKALSNPNINYIGIEKFDSVIIRALEKLLDNHLPNLLLIRIDAEKITEIFAPEEIDKIYLNFSDPWPKKRTAKRRLTSSQFLNRYAKILKLNGEIYLKTDNFKLYEFSMMSFNQNKRYSIQALNLNLYNALPIDNVQTEFEQRFVEKGNLIFYLKAELIKEI